MEKLKQLKQEITFDIQKGETQTELITLQKVLMKVIKLM